MAQPPEILVERRTGRSPEEFGIESGLSLEEKLARFEAAEYDLGFAEASLKRGHIRTDVHGDTKDIKEAILILKASAEYRASEISDKELEQARGAGLVSEAVADALKDRKSTGDGIDRRLDQAMKRLEGSQGLQDRPGQNRDDEPER